MATKASTPKVGTRAVNELRLVYLQGTPSLEVEGARDHLVAMGLPESDLTYDKVCTWLRQAALEEQGTGRVSVTNPVYINGYTRNSAPTADQRQESRQARRTDTATRMFNDQVEAIADAQRTDATKTEKALVLLYELATRTLETIETLA